MDTSSGHTSWADVKDDDVDVLDTENYVQNFGRNTQEYEPRQPQYDSYANNDRGRRGSRRSNHNQGRESFDNRRNRDFGNRRARPALSVEDDVEQGVVTSLKDSFGFIRCVEFEEDLFFHISEVNPEASLSIRPGSEVEFQRARDQRSGKVSAVRVNVLPPGTVQFEVTEREECEGVVESLPERQPGRIVDSEGVALSFLARDVLTTSVLPYCGDRVTFSVVLRKATKSRRAVNISVSQFADQREEGVIASLQSSYGFIKCADSPDSLFFHISDVGALLEGQQLDKGLCVSFSRGTDKKGQPIAIRLQGLPRGSVSFTRQWEERQQGVVVRPVFKELFRRERKPNESGLLRMTVGEDTVDLSFDARDVQDMRLTLKEDDEVEFDVVEEKRNNRKYAKNIVLIRAAPEKRERGIISDLRKDFGYIACENRKEELFFHFDEWSGSKIPQEGTDVEFVVQQDSRGKYKATSLTALPAGTITFMGDIERTNVEGLVSRDTKLGIPLHRQHPDAMGLVKVDEEEILFAAADLPNGRSLWPGDRVRFSVGQDKRFSRLRAVQIELVEAVALPEDTGKVTSLKSFFGFIRCVGREEEIFFHLTEVEEGSSVTFGSEVSFHVVKSQGGKQLAIRIKSLPPGSVSFSTLHEGEHTGTIEYYDMRSRRGKVRSSPATLNDEPAVYEFTAEDVDPQFSLRKDDTVAFRLATNKQTQTVFATQLQVQREGGTVKSLKTNFGFLKPNNPNKEDVYFAFTADSETVFHVGDSVTFLAKTRQRGLEAEDVVLVAGPERRLGPPKIPTARVGILRQPLAPGGSPPFGVGRGRLVK